MKIKTRRKLLALVAGVLSVSVLLSACTPNGDDGGGTGQDGTAPSGDGAAATVINFHAWNDQAQQRFERVVTLPEGVEVNWVITPNEGNMYQITLNNNLLNNPGSIDLFTVEADHIRNYVMPGIALDVINEVGLTQQDIQYMYPFTLQAASDENGVLRGVSWEANPGLFLYRRSIAQEVFGTDDPEYIQSLVGTWEGFNQVAQQMHDAGFQMLSGFDDSYRVFANNMANPLVDETNTIVIDPLIHNWIDQTAHFTESGFNNGSSLWDSVWTQDQGSGSTVFGFFYSTWGIAFTLLANSLDVPVAEGGQLEVGNGLFGDWGAVHGPASWNWGGTWIMAAESSTADREILRSIMYQMTVSDTGLRAIVEDFGDFVNNSRLMEEFASDPDFGNAFLGGQNHIALFVDTAPHITMDNLSQFDQAMTENIQASMMDYFNGVVDRDQAWENFFTAVTTLHPHLQRPA